MMLPPEHLRKSVRLMRELWTPLKGSTILFTGGTGFIGAWMIEMLAAAAQEFAFHARVVNVGRRRVNPDWLVSLARRGVELQGIQADVLKPLPPAPGAQLMVHGATDASAQLNIEQPQTMLDTIVNGTRNAIDWACTSGVERMLYLSSGAVYGPGIPDTPKSEEMLTGPDPLGSSAAYGEGKRVAEQLCAIAARSRRVPHVSIARCFAFAGPLLPLDTHFALGNLVRDGMVGSQLKVRGDGTAVRSYLHAGDLALWLWSILLHGTSLRPYNVGSARPLTIHELASVVTKRFAVPKFIDVMGLPTGGQRDYYVPDVNRAKRELGVAEWTSLDESIDQMIDWHQSGAANRFSTVM